MEAKIENEKYFHNVLCLSKAKGMDIKMEKECLHQNKNMKNAVVFSSKTGNTKQLADEIRNVLSEEIIEYFGSPETAPLDADCYYVGFWTDKGQCNAEIGTFLKKIKGKEVFLFGTAGFGGDPEYFDKILKKVEKNLDRSNILRGSYMCQGKMPNSVRERYVNMKNAPLPVPNIDAMIDNFDRAVSHPDEQDLEQFRKAVLASDNYSVI